MEKKGLKTKCEEFDEYLGCKIVFSKDGKRAWLGQPETINKLEREFGTEARKLRKYSVPGTPGIGILRPASNDDVVNSERQTKYRSGVGMLLWINKTRPYLSNAVRELSKVMDGATETSYEGNDEDHQIYARHKRRRFENRTKISNRCNRLQMGIRNVQQ